MLRLVPPALRRVKRWLPTICPLKQVYFVLSLLLSDFNESFDFSANFSEKSEY
jgi:hypothetical protein